MTFTQDHGCGIDLQKIACWQDKVRTTQTITTKLVNYIRLVTLITWLGVGGILLKFFLPNFLWNFPIFFKVKHSIGHISGMVCPIDLKQKGVASIGYWVSYVTSTLTSHTTLTFDFSWSNFKIALSQELSDRCEKSNSIKYRADCMGLPFDYTHPWPWPCSFKAKVWNSLIWGMGSLIDMELKGCESIIHDHDHSL